MFFSFDGEVAARVGDRAALIFHCAQFWIKHNEATNQNFRDGRHWMFLSTQGFCEIFPFLSESQIRRAISKLVESGLLMVGNYNTRKYDQTRWFALGPEGAKMSNGSDEIDSSILRNQQFHVTKTSNGCDEIDSPIQVNYLSSSTHLENEDGECASAPPAPARSSGTKSKKPVRREHGFYRRVLLSDSDMESLRRDFPTDLEDRIERVDSYCEATGKRYSNYAAVIRNWARRDREKGVEVYGSTSTDPRPDLVPKIKSAIDDLFDFG